MTHFDVILEFSPHPRKSLLVSRLGVSNGFSLIVSMNFLRPVSDYIWMYT